MQTFLPYPNFAVSALVLDWRRLGKQRVEARQILTAMDDPDNGWHNHPATKMWRGYRTALMWYGDCIIMEWQRRLYGNSMHFLISAHGEVIPAMLEIEMPHWLGDEAVHASHRSNLLRKEPNWYDQFGWTEPDNLEYIWP